MSFHLKRNLLIFATLMLVMQIAKSQDDPPPTESEEEDDSSSEETVEDSNEQRKRRRRRSLEVSDDSAEDPTKTNEQKVARAIPGLPDPATLIKIAEILKAVGDQVIPILTAGNTGSMEFIANRISRDMKVLKSFKNEIDVLTDNLTKQK